MFAEADADGSGTLTQAELKQVSPRTTGCGEDGGGDEDRGPPHGLLEGSFSAVSKPNFASKYAFELGSI